MIICVDGFGSVDSGRMVGWVVVAGALLIGDIGRLFDAADKTHAIGS